MSALLSAYRDQIAQRIEDHLTSGTPEENERALKTLTKMYFGFPASCLSLIALVSGNTARVAIPYLIQEFHNAAHLTASDKILDLSMGGMSALSIPAAAGAALLWYKTFTSKDIFIGLFKVTNKEILSTPAAEEPTAPVIKHTLPNPDTAHL